MLSKKTKYGIKALTFLARQENQAPVQIAEIAKTEHISIKFLESILLLLRNSGFLGAKKNCPGVPHTFFGGAKGTLTFTQANTCSTREW